MNRVQRAAVDTLPIVPVTRRPVVVRPPVERTTTVPGDVADRVRRIHAIDVSDVQVHSGGTVTDRTRELNARAFTTSGEIFMPDDPTTDTALLAHELVHVSQQREFGPDLPDERTEQGRQLEAEAVAVSDWFLGGPQPPPPLRHLRLAAPAPVTTNRSAPDSVAGARTAAAAGVNSSTAPTPVTSTTSEPPLMPMSWTPAQGFSQPMTFAGAEQPRVQPPLPAPDPIGTAYQQQRWAAEIATALAAAVRAPTTIPDAQLATEPTSAGPEQQPTEAAPEPAEITRQFSPAPGPSEATSPSTEPGPTETSPLANEPGRTEIAQPSTEPGPVDGGQPPIEPGPAGSGWQAMAADAPQLLAGPGPVEPAQLLPAVPGSSQAGPDPVEIAPETAQRVGVEPASAGQPGLSPANPGQQIPAAPTPVEAWQQSIPYPTDAAPPVPTDAAPPTFTGPRPPDAVPSASAGLSRTDLALQMVARQRTAGAGGSARPIDVVRPAWSGLSPGGAEPGGTWPAPAAPGPGGQAWVNQPIPTGPGPPHRVDAPPPTDWPPIGGPGSTAIDLLPAAAMLAALPTQRFPTGPTAEDGERRPAGNEVARPQDDVPTLAAISDHLGDDPPRNWLDLDDTEHLEQLAAKLYDRLHDRLRRDVLVQRERSGFLMDSW